MRLNNGEIEYDDPQEKFHIERYKCLLTYIENKNVLDIGGGGGWGAFVLSKSARKVTSGDADPSNIEYAKREFPAGNISYQCMNVLDLPYPDNSFDVAIACELIEHIYPFQHCKMLTELQRVLRPGGLLGISTPDKHRNIIRSVGIPYGWRKEKGHKKEYSLKEFAKLVNQYFDIIALYGQDIGRKMFGKQIKRKILGKEIDYGDINIVPEKIDLLGKASYIMIIAKKKDYSNLS